MTHVLSKGSTYDLIQIYKDGKLVEWELICIRANGQTERVAVYGKDEHYNAVYDRNRLQHLSDLMQGSAESEGE